MEGITGTVPAALSPEDPTGLVLLKKSQDLMALQATALLATLPAPGAGSPPASLPPSPAGVGGRIDVLA
jgi:hypothetical protein